MEEIQKVEMEEKDQVHEVEQEDQNLAERALKPRQYLNRPCMIQPPTHTRPKAPLPTRTQEPWG